MKAGYIMKKIKTNHIIIIIAALAIISLSVIIIYIMSGKNGLKEISYDKFTDLMSNNEYSIVYYGQEDCGACKSILPLVKEKSRELNIDVMYLDADSIKDSSELEKNNIKYAPSIIILDNGDVRVYDDINAENIDDVLLEYEHSIVDRPMGLNEISYDDLMQKMDLNYDMILYIGREDCRDCQKFHPIIEEYLDKENNAGAYYFSVKSFRDKSIGDDAKDEDVKFYEELKKEFDIQWVPSVYHIVNGKIISKYEFLSKQYYEIEDEQERDSAEKEFIDNFYKWYGIESQI